MLNKLFARKSAPESVSTALQSRLITHYQDKVDKGLIQTDPQQITIVESLQTLCDNLTATKTVKSKNQSKGLYLFGSVGSGKSMLMDLFYHHCLHSQKSRIHFHAFMRDVHARLKILRQIAPDSKTKTNKRNSHKNNSPNQHDLIRCLAQEISRNSSLLCFDEFHVDDIADAMILGRLFEQLFLLNVHIVCTSNYAPDKLYPNGLQRELFLPFIALIKQQLQVQELNTQQDYRLQHLLTFNHRYFFPLNEYADHLIHQSYAKLSQDAPKTPAQFEVLGRQVKISSLYGDIALSSFQELCDQALGSSDYLELASQISTLILGDIPLLSPEVMDATRRFIHLIDILYEHKIILICSADAPPQQLFSEPERLPEFQRSVSRLMEMQSEHYLKAASAAQTNKAL